ncbi:hypothetical protein [Weissella soli]|jgi:dUTP pyrophosphatase|uniref:Uncharacterized protein n=1 Tax=Weissella soli TaxID=155866 RepID=A0A288QVB3_9LACO|nr:hypothetical protein [Weissella soli]AOT56063.1 dUTP diphosphatase [Weissella soli]NKY82524.1 hypothetical protein [Weissella soli]RDL11637.1 hypothetical protein DFP99_0055 [Weissella soli]GEN93136.1 hypothetical protein WSO01_07480 [Weissella soli]GJM48074.1 hypothetical protein WSSLDB02_06310 [Weissella soli]
MRQITQHGTAIELAFDQAGLPGYAITAATEVVIPSVLSNQFLKGLNILTVGKQLKGLRDNPALQTVLAPVTVPTGITITTSDEEYITLVNADAFVQHKRLLLANPVVSGENIEVQFINLGLKDIKIKAGDVIATAIINQAVR